MSRINARAKGAAGEREFCRWIKMVLNLEADPKRNLEQVRSGGGDIVNVYPYCFEVKRVENLDLFSAWSQCYFAAQEADLIPIVAFRKNKQPWEFLIPAFFLNASLENGYVQLTEPVFKRWVIMHYQQYGA